MVAKTTDLGLGPSGARPLRGMPSLRGAFHYLAAIAAAAACGLLPPDLPLLSLAEDLLTELVDAVVAGAEPSWHQEDQRRVLLLLASDPRPRVRIHVARSASVVLRHLANDAESLLRDLARDRSPRVRAEAVLAFESLLERAEPIERVQLVCSWALSDNVTEREAVARALSAPLYVFVTEWVIEQLCRDGEGRVRLASVRAAAKHFDENPAAYGAIALQLALDSDRRVRRDARRLLRKGNTRALAAQGDNRQVNEESRHHRGLSLPHGNHIPERNRDREPTGASTWRA